MTAVNSARNEREKRPIAERIGLTLMEQVRETRPDLIVCDSETCRWNIAAATGVPCIHPVELFREALGIRGQARRLHEADCGRDN